MVVVSPPTVRLPVTVALLFTVRSSKKAVVEKRLVVVAFVPVAEVKVRFVNEPLLPVTLEPEKVESVMVAVLMELLVREPPFARS